MNSFEKMVDDCFKVPDFVENFTTDEGTEIICIAYSLDTAPQIATFGLNDGESLFITCKAGDYTPSKNAHVLFRGKLYKIDSFQLDPYGLSYKILLKTSYKKIEENEH